MCNFCNAVKNLQASARQRGTFRLTGRLNENSGDAAAVHFENRQAAAFVNHRLASLRNMAEPEKHETGQGFHAAVARQIPLHLGLEVAQVYAAIHRERSGARGQQRLRGNVELVLKLAGKLLDGVFGRNQTDNGAELIDNDRQMPAPPFEFLQQVEDRLGLRHDQNVAHDLAETQLNRIQLDLVWLDRERPGGGSLRLDAGLSRSLGR